MSISIKNLSATEDQSVQLPYRFAREKKVLVEEEGNKLKIKTITSVSLEVLSELRSYLNKPLEIAWLDPEQFERELSDAYTNSSTSSSDLVEGIDDNVQESVKKVPFLGDIPLLGRLFKTTSISRTKRNLMVFLRPTIVRDSDDVRAISNRKYNYFQAIENDLINSGKMVPDTTILKDLLESDELQ